MIGTEGKIDLLKKREILTQKLSESPYSYITFLERAECHEALGYPDLGVGDAYRALLLLDEASDESGEYHQQALNQFQRDSKSIEVATSALHQEDHSSPLIPVSEWSRSQCFALLSRLLIECGCLRSAYDFAGRGLEYGPSDSRFLDLRSQILKTYNTTLLEKDPNWNDWDYNPKTELPEQGHARREVYPWNNHEPDRFSEESLRFLNQQMKKVAPKCEVRAVSLPILSTDTPDIPLSSPPATTTTKQLGIFATQDIPPHETILQEISSLTANNRLHDPLCDACSAPFPPNPQTPLPTCPECDDTTFCSQSCHSAALSLYHPAVCGNPDLEALAKDPSPPAATNALYLLLLSRTFALSQTQNIHPLNLPETKYLWGDFAPPSSPPNRTLPFSFKDQIQHPLHLLSKMDINPFTSLPTTDTWITQTLLAKYRGVASARMNPRTGVPEVCAVHPMWCLANHSCAPNVRWEWVGSMNLVARGAGEVVRWGRGDGGDDGKGGIRKGEEVLNHYCDVELGVRERREWAAGALGGGCVCERCVWEEAEERRKEVTEGRKLEEKVEESGEGIAGTIHDLH